MSGLLVLGCFTAVGVVIGAYHGPKIIGWILWVEHKLRELIK